MSYVLGAYLKKAYLFQALKSIYGLSNFLSFNLCKRLGFKKNHLLKEITDHDISNMNKLANELKFITNHDLKQLTKDRIKNLIDLKTYRGIRYRRGLPVRGQRTHTNARTAEKLKLAKLL